MDRNMRVKMALNHREPDRVPRCELVIDEGLVKEFSGKAVPVLSDRINFLDYFGLDAVCLSPVEKGLPEMPVKIEELEKVLQEFIDAERDFSSWEGYSREGFFVFALINGSFGELGRLLGFEGFMMALSRYPQEIKKALEKLTLLHRQLAAEAVARGAGAVIMGDDIAHRQGPLISPEMMSRVFFPFWGEEASSIKKEGVPVIMHSEGDLYRLLPDLAEIYDGLHSLEPASGMSLDKVKKEYGHRLCLMGNLDLRFLFPGAEQEELEKAVKETMETGKPGGGFIFGTSGGLCSGLSLGNIEAMYRYAVKYG